ncbi:MAG: phosphate acyltransferase PlsX [Gemmatimonadota bacterium]|nr:phosphate acyltransferase PlsX [Gemmatimonadota bacterium]
MARIALDAMGGDHAPQAPVAGAILALSELDPSHSVQLIGQTGVITALLDALLSGELAQHTGVRQRLAVVDAPDVIEMSDKPASAIRHKQNSSMVVGLKMQAAGESDGFVSAGNTGAQMVASTVVLKLHGDLKRAAIGTLFPTSREPVVVLDSGANVDCSAQELVDFARLGSVYAQDILGRDNPAVALLSIGEEAEKGSKAVLEAHQLLKESDLNFVGNVEGRDILAGGSERGEVDVVVCDGFVGNTLLKFYESMPKLMVGRLKKSGVEQETIAKALEGFDYSDYGGAPLLGVRGVSIISHGSSSSRALKNALKLAVRAVESRLSDHIGRRLGDTKTAGPQ